MRWRVTKQLHRRANGTAAHRETSCSISPKFLLPETCTKTKAAELLDRITRHVAGSILRFLVPLQTSKTQRLSCARKRCSSQAGYRCQGNRGYSLAAA